MSLFSSWFCFKFCKNFSDICSIDKVHIDALLGTLFFFFFAIGSSFIKYLFDYIRCYYRISISDVNSWEGMGVGRGGGGEEGGTQHDKWSTGILVVSFIYGNINLPLDL